MMTGMQEQKDEKHFELNEKSVTKNHTKRDVSRSFNWFGLNLKRKNEQFFTIMKKRHPST